MTRKNIPPNGQQGFIALMSAIIISVVLLSVVLTLSIANFFLRFNILDAEYKKRSLALAEACAQRALLQLSANPSYLGNADYNITATDTCHVFPLVAANGHFIVRAQGIFPSTGSQRSYSNIQAVVNVSDFSIVSWDEVAVLP